MIRYLGVEDIANYLFNSSGLIIESFESKDYKKLRRECALLLEKLQRDLRIALGTNNLYLIEGLPETLFVLDKLRKIETEGEIESILKKFICFSSQLGSALEVI
jgi:hypothetical protein